MFRFCNQGNFTGKIKINIVNLTTKLNLLSYVSTCLLFISLRVCDQFFSPRKQMNLRFRVNRKIGILMAKICSTLIHLIAKKLTRQIQGNKGHIISILSSTSLSFRRMRYTAPTQSLTLTTIWLVTWTNWNSLLQNRVSLTEINLSFSFRDRLIWVYRVFAWTNKDTDRKN